MNAAQYIRIAGRGAAGALTLAVASYATYAGVTWLRHGRIRAARRDETDLLLDRFMPVYDVVEREHVRVGAPAESTLSATYELDLRTIEIPRGAGAG